MEYDKVRPAMGRFSLEAFGDVTFELRKFTGDDGAWCRETLEKDSHEIVNDLIDPKKMWSTMRPFSRLLFRMLTNESRQHFKTKTVLLVDDEGNEKDQVMSGPTLLLTSIVTAKDRNGVVQAMLDTLINSDPEVAKAAAEEEKKREQKEKKKSPQK